MSRIRIITAATALAAGLSLAACSSSSGGTAAQPPITAAGSTAASAPIGSATTPGTASSTPAGSTPTVQPGAGSGGDFCHQVTAAAAGIEKLGDANVRDLKPYVGELRSLVAAAPAAVKPDVLVLEQIDEQIVNGNRQARSQLNNPATAAHLRHFLSWMQTNCPGVLQNLPTS